jgi:fibro-slime domain-containing protein
MKASFFATAVVCATAILVGSCGSDNGNNTFPSGLGTPYPGNGGATGASAGGAYAGSGATGGYTAYAGGSGGVGGSTGIAGYGASILPPSDAGPYTLPVGFTPATQGGWKLGAPYDGKGPIGGVGGTGGAGGGAGTGIGGGIGTGGADGGPSGGGAGIASDGAADGAVDGAIESGVEGGVEASASGDGAAEAGSSEAGWVNEFADGAVPEAGVPDCGTTVLGVMRDFRRGDRAGGHPDFEKFESPVGIQGVLEQTLGADMKPVYVNTPHQLFTNKTNFDQWYRNVDGVNKAYLIEFSLQPQPNGTSFRFFSDAFFPLDGTGWGNEDLAHNYHFTTEVHTQFYYVGGEVFTFKGDDDLWVYVNNRLGIDLGGLHPPLQRTINMDAMATTLGIEKGKVYPLDLFHAERHTVLSNFEINTNLHFVNCGIIVPDIH